MKNIYPQIYPLLVALDTQFSIGETVFHEKSPLLGTEFPGLNN